MAFEFFERKIFMYCDEEYTCDICLVRYYNIGDSAKVRIKIFNESKDMIICPHCLRKLIKKVNKIRSKYAPCCSIENEEEDEK